jgi:hypothetical protein
MTDIVSAVGKALGSSAVTDVLNSLDPVRVVEDPPFRTYVGSPEQGLDLLVENERVISGLYRLLCKRDRFKAEGCGLRTGW